MVDPLNYQALPKGFDSYLIDIIPNDQAVAAGAFSVSMQQIRDVEKADTLKFAKVVYNMESTIELPETNGTDVPTDPALAAAAQEKMALGSGVYGTYTMSNFYGAMSGLPYPWKNLYDNIKNIQSQNLITIYQNLYLAVKWNVATVSVQTSYNSGTGLYTVTGITLSSQGGGYGRGGASAPTITLSNGGAGTTTIGTDPSNLNTYGKVLSVTLTSAGSPSLTIPTATVASPPGPGWPGMNSVVQGYIDSANAEIASIKNQNAALANLLNTYWGVTGTALKHEQRARFHAITPVDIPFDNRFGLPISTFVDLLPNYAPSTEPNMAVQTLENISDRNSVGGQSIVAVLREERNKERLVEVGIDQDNNVPNKLDPNLAKQLILNGTVPGAVEGIVSPNGDIYTIPANPSCPQPYNYYDDGLKVITSYAPGSIQPILDGNPNPTVNPNSPSGPGVTPEAPINPWFINPNVNTFPVPNINSDYTGSTLCPSTYNVNDAIDKVIECNCDCWVK